MTEFATFTGKNVDEAVNNALLQLQITSEKLEYEVVEKRFEWSAWFYRF